MQNITTINIKKHLNSIKNLERNISDTQSNISKLEEDVTKLVAKIPLYEKQLTEFKQENNVDKITATEKAIQYCKEGISARNIKVNKLNVSLKTFLESIKKHTDIIEKHAAVEENTINLSRKQTINDNIESMIVNISTTEKQQTISDNNNEHINKINVLELYIERAITQLNNIDS